MDNESYTIMPSTAAEVKSTFNKKNQNKKWIKIVSGPEKALVSFDKLAANLEPNKVLEAAKSYGGKASKLMLLAHKKMAGLGSSIQNQMGYRLTPIGFGVPVSAYTNFVNSNLELKNKIQFLVESEMGIKGKVPLSPKQRIEMIKVIQGMFYETEIPLELAQKMSEQVKELQATAELTYPKSKVKKLKIRSSANAEDIPNFDGAGLHSSFSAEIDQSSAVMGLAVNTSYDFRKKTEDIKEVANAVLVTRIINTKGIYGYRLSVNTDENLVTNPTPVTQAEIMYAKMIQIARSVETSYCRSIYSYYPGQDCNYVTYDLDKPSSLDMEFKIYSNGEVLLKQAREFSGR
ncbi:MAG: hypothetical protein H7235_04390 [Bdellovibrionaceae bacterium]|nr:hypothetical protein [Pseudobdellovibrionaceae bacterium]